MPSRARRFYNVPNFTHQAYRCGIALSCIGVLLNWLGVAQAYIEPIRYIGVGLVVVGSFLIISALCQWMFLSPSPTTTVHEVSSEEGNGGGGVSGGGGGGSSGDLHIITVPMGRSQGQSRSAGMSSTGLGKPPDYFMVTEKPPSYEEAMSMLPPYPGFLQLSTDGRSQDEYLAPHQVPESHQSEGATSTLLWQRDGRPDLRGGQDEAMLAVSLIPHNNNNPPLYSSQASLSDFSAQNMSPRSDIVASVHTTPDYSNSSSRNSSARALYTNHTQENTHGTQTNRSATVQESTHSTQTDTTDAQQDTHATQTHRSDSEENIHNTHVNNGNDDTERVSLSDSKCKTPDISEDENNKEEESNTKASVTSLDRDEDK
ncbi:hypothetical protein Pmani_020709 [Petrolisthes manimaculis]|uniref:Uncharacterized protein n=1 Tax=Petrolisthes manimaculis TaxID=1843537 RepID=A0AAE1U634_9EUCA|nr:hypothetical protein Pmani_020709 [Petrolisthes manimaculis]